MEGYLTTHVLDTASGQPGVDIPVELYRIDGDRRLIMHTTTNDDGRCDQPLLSGEAFVCGVYELLFKAGDYFRKQGIQLPEPAFLDEVVLRFGISEAGEHYHVPLLISPYSFSTYRGS